MPNDNVLIRTLSAALLALASASAGAQEYQKLDEIVAVVNEGVVLRSELESAIDSIRDQIRQRGGRMPPRQVLEEQVLERLIMSTVQVQRAEQTGILVTDQEVDRALDDVARQNRLTLSQLRQALEEDGVDFNEFRDDVREQLITQRLRQRIVESMEQPTETEVDIMLQSGIVGGEEYNLSQIALQVPSDATPDQLREIEQRVGEIYQRIQEGMGFPEAAINFSEASNALEGGQVGWRSLNAMPREMADAIRELEPGEITEPIVGNGSVMIVKINDRRPRGEIMVNEFQARHILISPSELMSPERARQLARELRQRIDQGEDFDELAREYSDDPRSANLGGLMEWFPEGAYGRTIQQVCNTLDPGEVSEPFQTNEGWHILKLEGQREADRTEETLRNEARNMIVQQRAEDEVERMLRQFRDEAYVEKLL